MTSSETGTSEAATTVAAGGRSWPVDAATVTALVRRLERERSARLAAEEIAEEATRLSLRDDLTGLPNRRHLLADGHHDDAVLYGPAAVLFIDLDRFKLVNETWGHDAGDEALVEVAARLRQSVRPTDTVTRLGGDEFVCVCHGIDAPAGARDVAGRIVRVLDEPHAIDGRRQLRLAASIGIALGRAGDPVQQLVRNASAAVNIAKTRRRGSVALYDHVARSATRDRLELESQLRSAVDAGRIDVRYQPVFRLADGRVTGVEALARWHEPSRGDVPPDVFVPLAEQLGLIHDLDLHVLQRAIEDIGPMTDLTIATNVSALEIVGQRLADDVERAVATSGIDPGRLWLEITESAWLTPVETAIATVDALEALGLRIAIDDFGTGYSPLAHLQRLPVDALKVDRSFVAGVPDDERDAVIVRTIAAMADALDLGLVAEGVETHEQRAGLLDIGVESAQGWLLAPALHPDELADLVAAPPPFG